MSYFDRLMNDRAPVRNTARWILRQTGVGGYRFRLTAGGLKKPHYAYIMERAANLASKLGLARISVLEFGVAGGAGLLAMEYHAAHIERLHPSVKIDIYGFDTAAGLPSSSDVRDLLYHWRPGFFEMDVPKLERRLGRSTLVVGDVRDTLGTFLAAYAPAPIGAIANDLDYYTSTVPTLDLFAGPADALLPRVYCYFDDTVGGDVELYSDFTGQRRAIDEFNAASSQAKIAIPYHLRLNDGGQVWRHQIWIAHRFDHPLYNRFIGENDQQIPI